MRRETTVLSTPSAQLAIPCVGVTFGHLEHGTGQEAE